MDPNATEAVKSRKESYLRRLAKYAIMGLLGVYPRSIEGFLETARPLYHLLNGEKSPQKKSTWSKSDEIHSVNKQLP